MQAQLQARNESDAVQPETARTERQEGRFVDNRPAAVAQRERTEMLNDSERVLQQRALSEAIHNSPRMVTQRHDMNASFGGAVRAQGDGAMSAELSPVQREEKPNNTGLPNQLKSGIESLSGMSMDHVKVHYNSDKPAQLQAHAYAQGNEIHLGAGQERHLPHEAWHVVQQAQGRVRPTLQMKAGAVNDDPSLEQEADMMGARAVQMKTVLISPSSGSFSVAQQNQALQRKSGVVAMGKCAARSDGPMLQMLRGNLTQDIGDDIYLYDAETNESYDLTDEDRNKANVGDQVGYRIMPGNMAKITDWTGMDTVASIINDIAQQLGITNLTRLSLALDFSRADILNTAHTRRLLKRYLEDWTQFTACYNTAQSLFSLLNTGVVVDHPGGTLSAKRDALILAVNAAASNGAIFKIRCGIHGFVILVRGGANVELLQSFAGASGEMVATSIQNNKSWPLGTMCTLLTNMVDDDQVTRDAAQTTLFEGVITADAWPPAEYTWQRSEILTPEEIADAVMEKLKSNNDEISRQLR